MKHAVHFWTWKRIAVESGGQAKNLLVEYNMIGLTFVLRISTGFQFNLVIDFSVLECSSFTTGIRPEAVGLLPLRCWAKYSTVVNYRHLLWKGQLGFAHTAQYRPDLQRINN